MIRISRFEKWILTCAFPSNLIGQHFGRISHFHQRNNYTFYLVGLIEWREINFLNFYFRIICLISYTTFMVFFIGLKCSVCPGAYKLDFISQMNKGYFVPWIPSMRRHLHYCPKSGGSGEYWRQCDVIYRNRVILGVGQCTRAWATLIKMPLFAHPVTLGVQINTKGSICRDHFYM